MRKIKLQVQMTIDGFIGEPNGEMDWVSHNWTPDTVAYVQELTDSMDTILLGRKLAEGFIPHWAGVAADSASPEQAVGKLFSETPKIVFSNTLKTSEWEHTEVASDPVKVIGELKKQDGKDILVYGGATFVGSLISNGLIDELHVFVNPTAIGSGISIFSQLTEKRNYKLIKAQAFEGGMALLVYQPE